MPFGTHLAYMGRTERHRKFWWGNLTDHLEGLDFGGIITMDLIKIGWEGVFRTHLTQNMEEWRAVVTN